MISLWGGALRRQAPGSTQTAWTHHLGEALEDEVGATDLLPLNLLLSVTKDTEKGVYLKSRHTPIQQNVAGKIN